MVQHWKVKNINSIKQVKQLEEFEKKYGTDWIINHISNKKKSTKVDIKSMQIIKFEKDNNLIKYIESKFDGHTPVKPSVYAGICGDDVFISTVHLGHDPNDDLIMYDNDGNFCFCDELTEIGEDFKLLFNNRQIKEGYDKLEEDFHFTYEWMLSTEKANPNERWAFRNYLQTHPISSDMYYYVNMYLIQGTSYIHFYMDSSQNGNTTYVLNINGSNIKNGYDNDDLVYSPECDWDGTPTDVFKYPQFVERIIQAMCCD